MTTNLYQVLTLCLKHTWKKQRRVLTFTSTNWIVLKGMYDLDNVPDELYDMNNALDKLYDLDNVLGKLYDLDNVLD